MSKYKNLPEFRLLLANAISTRTQAEFSADAGIAPAMLSRMLNQEEIGTPSKKTLRKIAEAAKDFDGLSKTVTYEKLLKACGYSAAPASAMCPDSFRLFAEETLQQLCHQAFDSLDDMAKTILANQTDISYRISKKSEAFNKDNAEYAAVIRFSTQVSSSTLAMVDALVLYYQTVTGKLIVADVTCDAKRAAAYGGETAEKLLELRCHASQDGKTEDGNILYLKNRRYEPMSPEKLLLGAIFGTGQNTATEHISGIGFYLQKNMPEYVFKDFLKAHRETFCQNAQDEEIFKSYVEEGVSSQTEAFSRYRVDTVTGAGGNTWLGAIVSIIYRETGINVQGWLNALYYEDKPYYDCIVFPVNMPWMFTEAEKKLSSEQELILLLDKYAFELRAEVTTCDFVGKLQKETRKS